MWWVRWKIKESNLPELGFGEFENNSLLQDGVIRKIELIGEAAKRLSDSFWESYRDTLPLAEAASTRKRKSPQLAG